MFSRGLLFMVLIMGLSFAIPVFDQTYGYYQARQPFNEPKDKKLYIFGLFPTSNTNSDNEDTLRFG